MSIIQTQRHASNVVTVDFRQHSRLKRKPSPSTVHRNAVEQRLGQRTYLEEALRVGTRTRALLDSRNRLWRGICPYLACGQTFARASVRRAIFALSPHVDLALLVSHSSSEESPMMPALWPYLLSMTAPRVRSDHKTCSEPSLNRLRLCSIRLT